jgi:hypothetical protein|tara:strand:+ start:11247 stop:12110 length:864 start_codon:yes stop_codon:yes gene_type:complete
MLLKFKTYSVGTPAKTGPEPWKQEFPFNEEDERKSILLMLGIDSSLTDEELVDYKTTFSMSFTDILDDDSDGVTEYSVLDYMKTELDSKRDEIISINNTLSSDYDEARKGWLEGGTTRKTIEIPLDDGDAEKLISETEELAGFVEWVDEYNIEQVDPQLYNLKKEDVELEAYEVGDKVVLLPKKNSELDAKQIELLASENSLACTKIDINDVPIDAPNVLSIYQFYEYIDSNRGNMDEVLSMVIDRDETDAENKELVPDMGHLPTFASKATVEKFREDDILGLLGDI